MLPPQLHGRVDPGIWAQFIAAINGVIASKPAMGCCVDATEVFNATDLMLLRQQFQSLLGCSQMELMRYEYTAYNHSSDGPTWNACDILYVHLQWQPRGGVVAQPQVQVQQQPMMMPAGVVVAPMMMVPTHPGGQPVYVNPMMAQPQLMRPV
jgi:hypothetical protein